MEDGALKDSVEAYKAQNLFLNKEILELNLLRKHAAEREDKLITLVMFLIFLFLYLSLACVALLIQKQTYSTRKSKEYSDTQLSFAKPS